MKSSYKVSLLIATVLCIVVVWYYASQLPPNEATADIQRLKAAQAAGAADPAPVVADPAPPRLPAPITDIKLDGSARPAPAAAPAPQPPAATTYTVQSGDSFTRIAVKLYGSESRWDELAKANPTVDPGKLRVGQVLKLPGQAILDRGESSREPAAAAPGDTVIYTVKAGDTLSDIAQVYYGDTSRWRYLYSVNRPAIGSNPNNLKAGMKLKVPPTPKAAE